MARRIDIEAERLFENNKVSGQNPRAKQSKFYCATSVPAKAFDAQLLERMKGKRVPEIGCSDGEMSEK